MHKSNTKKTKLKKKLVFTFNENSNVTILVHKHVIEKCVKQITKAFIYEGNALRADQNY